jgi:hypothetical protein
VASRLTADRRFVVQTTSEFGCPAGTRWRWKGNTIECGGVRVYDLQADKQARRRPTPQEQAGTWAPYRAGPPPRSRALEPVDDDAVLDKKAEAAALEAVRLEQEHRPPDLVNLPIAA